MIQAAKTTLQVASGFALLVAAEPGLEPIKKDLFFLAGEACEGRGLETAGIRKAGDYIADTFKQAGLKPAGKDGSYFQPFTVYGVVALIFFLLCYPLTQYARMLERPASAR